MHLQKAAASSLNWATLAIRPLAELGSYRDCLSDVLTHQGDVAIGGSSTRLGQPLQLQINLVPSIPNMSPKRGRARPHLLNRPKDIPIHTYIIYVI